VQQQSPVRPGAGHAPVERARLSDIAFFIPLEEIRMGVEEERPQTFVERVLAMLEERFPWLGSGRDEPVGGANTVNDLSDLYKSLIEQRDRTHGENGDHRFNERPEAKQVGDGTRANRLGGDKPKSQHR
jgi:hypothetical protein